MLFEHSRSLRSKYRDRDRKKAPLFQHERDKKRPRRGEWQIFDDEGPDTDEEWDTVAEAQPVNKTNEHPPEADDETVQIPFQSKAPYSPYRHMRRTSPTQDPNQRSREKVLVKNRSSG